MEDLPIDPIRIQDESHIAVDSRDVDFIYPNGHKALDRFNLQIPSNRLFGILGPNGSGKSTFFKHVVTAVPIQNGSLHVLGLDASSQQSEIRNQLGVVFQSASLDPLMTARQNIVCHAAMYRKSSRDIQKHLDRYSHRLQINDLLDTQVRRMSGGQQKRVEIVKALIASPKLLVMDEPSAGLDPNARQQLLHCIRELVEDGISVVLITHLMEEAQLCDEIALLNKGKVVIQGNPIDLVKQHEHPCVTIRSNDAQNLKESLKQFGTIEIDLSNDQLTLVSDVDIQQIIQTIATLDIKIQSMSIKQSDLLDVFQQLTGSEFEGIDQV